MTYQHTDSELSGSSRWWLHMAIGLLAASWLVGCGKSPESPLANAKKLLFNKQYARALAEVDAILAEASDDYDALVLRGQINLKSGQETAALADFTKAIEASPMRPKAYSWRMDLYTSMADRFSSQGEDSEEYFRLLELANADRVLYVKFDPSASDTLKNAPSATVPKSLLKPLPGFDPLAEESIDNEIEERIVGDRAIGDDIQLPDDPNAASEANTKNEELAQTQEPDRENENDDQQEPGVATRPIMNEFVTDPLDSERKIQDQDLIAGNSDDAENLPLHEDEPEEPPVEPEIAPLRNDLGAFRPRNVLGGPDALPTPFSLPLPQPRTTGITQSEPEPPSDDRARSTVNWNRRAYETSPFLSKQGNQGVGSPTANPQVRSTGILSNQTTQAGGFGARLGNQRQNLRSPFLQAPGFIPPSARDKFGPHLGPSGNSAENSGNSKKKEPGGKSEGEQQSFSPRLHIPNRRNLQGTPLISTALPNTTRFHGANQSPVQINQFDPRNSPFGQRQTPVSTLPTLPPQQ